MNFEKLKLVRIYCEFCGSPAISKKGQREKDKNLGPLGMWSVVCIKRNERKRGGIQIGAAI